MDAPRFEEVTVSPDYRYAFRAGNDRTLSLFSTGSPDPVHIAEDVYTRIGYGWDWSADGRYLAYTTFPVPPGRQANLPALGRVIGGRQLWIVELSPASNTVGGTSGLAGKD